MKTSVDFIKLCCSLLILNQCSAQLNVPIITIVDGSNPINESNILSLTCFTNTTQRTVVTWYFSGIPMQAKPDGSVTISGVPYDRYRILSGNSTLRIIPNYMDDNVYFQCQVSYPDLGGARSSTSGSWSLRVNYRPIITSVNPTWKRANPLVNYGVNFYAYYQSYPVVTSTTSSGVTWTFRPINATSSLDDVTIPVQSTAPYYFNVYFGGSYSYISFSLRPGLLYTGNYTCLVYNFVGSTTVVFQVLDTGPPEPPTGLVLNPTPISINVQWTSMWSNGLTQSFAAHLINLDTNAIIGFQTNYYDPGYNSTTAMRFSDNIHPLTTYKVRLWSYNSKGNSSVVEAVTRTPPMPVLSVSESSINISGSLATVNYSISNINSSSTSGYVFLEIVCCESPVSATTCGRVSFPVYSYQMTWRQSLVIPLADQYYFQFRLSSMYSELFSAVDIKVGGKNSTTTPTDSMSTGSMSSSTTGAVVALAVLLTLSLVVIVGLVGALVVMNYRHKKSPTENDKTSPPGLNGASSGTENQNFHSGLNSEDPGMIESTTNDSSYMSLKDKQVVIDEAVYEKLQQKPPTKNKPRRN